MNGPSHKAKVRAPKKSRRRRSRQKQASASTLAIIDGLLLRKMRVSLSGKEQEVTALEAIIHQLIQKEVVGDSQASRVLLKYEQLERLEGQSPRQITFVEDHYTQRLTAIAPGTGDG